MPCHAETIFTPSLPNCSPDVCAVNADEKTSSNGIFRPWRRLTSLEIIASCPEGKLAPSFIRMRKGMLGSRANQNRHQPIKYWMFGRDGIGPISSWVNRFRNTLYPWGGPYRFKDGASCEDGPVYSPSLKYYKSGGWVEPDRRAIAGGIEVVPCALDQDIPQIYKEYLQSYVNDLKEIYALNLWPCAGVDYWEPEKQPEPVRSAEAQAAMRRAMFRPWGGELALKWPKVGQTFEFDVAWCDPKKEFDTQVFVPDDCPYYEIYMKEGDRRTTWALSLNHDDDDDE